MATSFHEQLTPVDLSEVQPATFDDGSSQATIKAIHPGLRPARHSGPNISLEHRGKALVIHNYGHGGAGWTLAHGSVAHTLELFQSSHPAKDTSITVIGAGVMGLLTSLHLHELGYRNLQTVARDFDNVTSSQSTGFYAPVALGIEDEQQKQFIYQLGFNTYDSLQKIANGKHPFLNSGIRPIHVYTGMGLGPGPVETVCGLEPYVEAGIIPLPETGIVDFGNGCSYPMRRFATYFMDTLAIMQELRAQLHSRSINQRQQVVNHLDEISADVIFNCSGLGARELNNDPLVHPNLGLLLHLQNQPVAELDYIIYTRFSRNQLSTLDSPAPYIYFMPKGGGLLGATFSANDNGQDEKANHRQAVRIIEDNKAFFGT